MLLDDLKRFMFEEDSMEKHVERKLLLARLMREVFNMRPGSKSGMLWGSSIIEFQLLKNFETFYIAVERVVEELSPGFEIAIREYHGGENDILSFTIDNPKRLDKYIAEKEVELEEVKKETSRHSFILDKEANLYLVDSELPPYSIERGSLRHKLIYYLSKHGGYMSAAQIAKRVDSNPKTIRKTVGQLRDMVIERFNVPGTDLIQSKDTGSYCASSILLRVPKGYTP